MSLLQLLRTGGGEGAEPTPTFDTFAEAVPLTPVMAFSFRDLGYGVITQPINIIRLSDSTTTDIGWDVNGDLDEAAITAFCTGTECQLMEWRNQVANGNLVQTIATTKRPIIFRNGNELLSVNIRPAVLIKDNRYMHGTLTTPIASQSVTVFSMMEAPAALVGLADVLHITGATTAGYRPIRFDGSVSPETVSQWYYTDGGGTLNINGQNVVLDYYGMIASLMEEGRQRLRVDGVGAVGDTATSIAGNTAMDKVWLGQDSTGGNGFSHGRMQETVVFDDPDAYDLYLARAELDMNNYYGL